MRLIHMKASQEAHASAERAWDIIGPQFLNIADWSRGIHRSWENEKVPNRINGAPAGGRYTFLGQYGTADERIIHYDAKNMEITWSARLSFLPNFVSSIRHALNVREIDNNLCLLSNIITVEANSYAALLLKKRFENQFRDGIEKFLIDWATYAETGEVSEAKKIVVGKHQLSKV
jgi:hypothetical protein